METTKSVKWESKSGIAIEAKITVSKNVNEVVAFADGYNVNLGSEIVETIEIAIYIDGKYHSKSNELPRVIEAGKYPAKFVKEMKAAGAHARVTDLVNCNEKVYAEIINAVEEAINEIKAIETTEAEKAIENEEEAKAIEEEIEWAEKVMKESAGRTEILNRANETEWIRSYNNLHNEGGYGYTPQRVTTEDVTRAKQILSK
jgi:hypothetical protein